MPEEIFEELEPELGVGLNPHATRLSDARKNERVRGDLDFGGVEAKRVEDNAAGHLDVLQEVCIRVFLVRERCASEQGELGTVRLYEPSAYPPADETAKLESLIVVLLDLTEPGEEPAVPKMTRIGDVEILPIDRVRAFLGLVERIDDELGVVVFSEIRRLRIERPARRARSAKRYTTDL